MKTDFLKKSGASFLRIIAALAIVLGIITLIYLLWQPGSDKPLPEYSNNAVWLGHGHGSGLHRSLFKREWLTPERHIKLIKIFSIMVGLIYLVCSYYMAQLDYIKMFVDGVFGVWLSGCGPMFLFGLYSRFGTSAGASQGRIEKRVCV